MADEVKALGLLRANWKFFFVLAMPVILCPLVLMDDTMEVNGEVVPSKKLRCAYVVILMMAYWVLDAVPLTITAMLPVVLFPMLEVDGTDHVSDNYMREGNMLFMASLLIALAIERSNLHKRIALRFVLIAGRSPTRIMLGTILSAGFLSMWMSDTAAATLMMPIVLATTDFMSKGSSNKEVTSDKENPSAHAGDPKISGETASQTDDDDQSTDDISPPPDSNDTERRRLLYLLATAYGTLIGGTGVVGGSGPNLVGYNLVKAVNNIPKDGKYVDLSFSTWMAYNILPTLLNLFCAWAYFYVLEHGVPDSLAVWRSENSNEPGSDEKETTDENVTDAAIQAESDNLGPISFHEAAVALLVIVATMLWKFRDPRFIDGWGTLFPSGEVGDATVAVLIVVLIFAIPKDLSFLCGRVSKRVGGLLEWKFVKNNFRWGVLFLTGVSFAISDACVKSRLAEWILDNTLMSLENLPKEVILAVAMIFTACVTEILPNAACANIIVPVLLSMSERLKLHPLYLALPVTVSCSFAFMTPVSAAPNAVAFIAAGEKTRFVTMMKIGIWLKVVCLTVLFISHITFGNLVFKFSNYGHENSTNMV